MSALFQVNRDLVKQRRNARLFQKTDFTGAGNNGEKKTRGNGLDMLKRLENELGSHKGAVLPLLQVCMHLAKGRVPESVFCHAPDVPIVRERTHTRQLEMIYLAYTRPVASGRKRLS